MIDATFKKTMWSQFGAAIDALENAIKHCPNDLWGDQSRRFQYWIVVSHTLFWLDYYLTASREEFTPPEPFGLEELDPAGRIPERVYTKEELLGYLEHGRSKLRSTLENLTEESAARVYDFGKRSLTFVELMLYTLRHVQHHTAQLNLVLREETNSAPGWTFESKIQW
jgi:hypothetical protein